MIVKTPVHLDYATTIPVDKRVIEKTIPYLAETFGNPASNSHVFGWEAEEAVEKTHADIIALINTDSKEIIFINGTTEFDNLAIKGTANFHKTKGKHLITIKTEYKAVLNTIRELECQNFEVIRLGVKENDLIDLKELKAVIRGDTILTSAMWVNNEIGIVQDVPAIGEICRERKIIFHASTTQVCGKVPVDVEAAKIDLLSMPGHKVYGLKGISALYVCRKPHVCLKAQVHDGGHERGFRGDILLTHQIVGMGEASRIIKGGLEQDITYYHKLRDISPKGIEGIGEVYINSDLEYRAPSDLNVSSNFVEGESLIIAVKELAIFSGSVCTSISLEPSYVLHMFDRSDELAHSFLCITFGHMTTGEEAQSVVELIKSKVDELRKLSLLWEIFKDGIDLNSIGWAVH